MTSLQPGMRLAVQLAFEERDNNENAELTEIPLPSKIFCDTVAEEYDTAFRTAMAGLMFASPVDLVALQESLRTYEFQSWGESFAAYWQSTLWLPAGIYVSGVTTNHAALAAPLQAEIDDLIYLGQPAENYENTMEEFADRLASILYTYTTELIVQAVITPPPYTKTEMVI